MDIFVNRFWDNEKKKSWEKDQEMMKGKLPLCSCCCCIYLAALITLVNDTLVKVRLKC